MNSMVRTALLGMAAYRLSWFDAHLWAYAEHYGMPEILSEDFAARPQVRHCARKKSIPGGWCGVG